MPGVRNGVVQGAENVSDDVPFDVEKGAVEESQQRRFSGSGEENCGFRHRFWFYSIEVVEDIWIKES